MRMGLDSVGNAPMPAIDSSGEESGEEEEEAEEQQGGEGDKSIIQPSADEERV